MHTDDFPESLEATDTPIPGTNVYPLRLVSIQPATFPQRRRTPRRQTVEHVAFDRRQGDRRLRQPGIDGLLRMVLSDSWE